MKKVLYLVMCFFSFFLTLNNFNALTSISEFSDTSKYKNINNIKVNSTTINSPNTFIDYNTFYIDIDQVFPILSNYYGISNYNNTYSGLFNEFSKQWHYTKIVGSSASQGQAYRTSTTVDSITFTRKEDQSVIVVPDKYSMKVSSSSVMNMDDTTNVGVEYRNGKYYIPLHFLEAMPLIDVSINNNKLTITSKKVSDYNTLSNKRVYKNGNTYTGYVGDEDSALWRKEALKRIEKYRKNKITVVVKDEKGNLVEDAKVNFKMTKNSFKFGTSIANEPVSGSGKSIFTSDINTKYFNYLGSGDLLKNTLSTNYDKARKLFLSDAKAKGFTELRGHTMFWDKSTGYQTTIVVNTQDTNKFKEAYTAFKNKNSSMSNQEIKSLIIDLLNGSPLYTAVLDYKNNNMLNYLTMHSIYELYKNGTVTKTEVDEILLPCLKQKFKNIVMSYIDYSVNYSGITEWDIFNELGRHEYFKYYLFEGKFLDEPATFFNLNSSNVLVTSNLNVEVASNISKATPYTDEYKQFLSDCIKRFRSHYSNNVKVVINDTSLNGTTNYKNSQVGLKREISLINSLKSAPYNNVIDALGIQHHVNGNIYATPMSYYNNIRDYLSLTGVSTAKITEYDNVPASNISISDEIRAKYLRDILIANYSNSKVNEFILWVYTNDSNFTSKEREVYKSVVYPWLNENITIDSGEYSSRLNIGLYDITVTVDKDKYVESVIKKTNENTYNDRTITVTVKNKIEPVDKVIKNYEPNTKIEDIDPEKEYIVKVKDKDGKEKTKGILVTGDNIKLYKNDILKNEYIVSIKGDLNSDGVITKDDVTTLYKYLKEETLPDYYADAGDIVSDNNIKINDVAKLYQYVSNKINSLDENSTTKALTGSINISCPRTEIAISDIMECAITGTTSDPISSISATIKVDGNVNTVNLLTSAMWEGKLENDSIELYTDKNKKEIFEIGLITISGIEAGEGIITVENIKYYDDKFNEYEIPKKDVSININPELEKSDKVIESDIKITVKEEKQDKINILYILIPTLVVLVIVVFVVIYLIRKKKKSIVVEQSE